MACAGAVLFPNSYPKFRKRFGSATRIAKLELRVLIYDQVGGELEMLRGLEVVQACEI
jgi:hypothetical protein